MFEGLLALSLSITSQAAPWVTVDKETVTAQGTVDVVVKVARPGMVHLGVVSDVGVACTVIDHLRGPFFDDGVVGKTSCNVDTLLDQGLYKLRLTSPGDKPGAKTAKNARAAPSARVDVTGFADVDAPLVLLPGRTSVVTLPVRKQVTRWLRVPQRQEIVVDVWGRTAGQMALWRDGQWVEDTSPRASIERPVAGRPVHHLRLQQVVDPGDYAVVVYGARPQSFTNGADDDTVFIGYDAPPASSSRSEVFTLPAWGSFSVRTPTVGSAGSGAGDGGVAAFLTIDGKRSEAISLTAEAVVDDSSVGLRRGNSTVCGIDPTQPLSACTLTSSQGNQKATILEVRGPPGTSGRLVWMPLRATDNLAVGDAQKDGTLELGANIDAVAVAGLPQSIDAAPIGCALDRLDAKGNFVSTVARDVAAVGLTQAWKRKFNSDATSVAVWLDIETAGVYGITGNDKLGASCEVFRLDDASAGSPTAKKRVAEGKDGACNHKIPLPKGPIEVRFYGGKPGIQELRVGQVGLAALVGNDDEAPMRGGCFFSGLSLTKGRYRVRTSGNAGAALRTVFGIPKGLGDAGSAVVAVDPGRTLSFDLAPGASVQAKNSGPGAFNCALADGTATRALSSCETGVLTSSTSSTKLTLTNSGTRPALAIVGRVPAPVASPPLDPWNGAPPRLPVVKDGATAWFDLDDTTGKSFVVEVAQAGLFDVGTEGLLATRCAVRTAVSSKLFSGDQNGRGRNCLVESYLKPGRYLVSVDAQGTSRGRAGLRLTAKPAWAGGDLTLGDERFVTVDAGALARHTFSLKNPTQVDWAVQAQGASLSCRLDDDDGWPLHKVPHECAGNEELAAGRYTLSVLPLTVESRRSLRLGEPAVQQVLSGNNKVHALALNNSHRVELGSDGKDTFVFSVPSDVDVGVVVNGGMQGRIYEADATSVKTGKKGEVVAAIAPPGGSQLALSSSPDDGGDGGDGEVDDGGAPEDEGQEYGEYNEGGGEYGDGEGSGDGEYNEGNGDGEYNEGGGGGARGDGGRSASDMLRATVHQPLPALSGQIVHLKAGSYVLETEHSRGDVGVSYDVGVFVRALVPGSVLVASVPAVIDVEAPAAGASGLVRIKTRGQTDVGCRLLDDKGTLVASSTGSGADWNCALAVPLAHGTTYRLYVDAEVLQTGSTILKAEFLEAKDTGALQDGDTFKLVGKVARSTLVPVNGKVMDVQMTATEDFSCAAFDVDGTVLDRQVGVRTCSLLLWGNDDVKPFSVLTWTADRPASVKVALRERGLKGLSSGGLGGVFSSSDLDDDVIAAAAVPSRGRFETAPNARCLPKKTRGALLPCPVAWSFDPKDDGDTVLVGVVRGERATVPFSERIAKLEKRQSDSRTLGARQSVERQQTKQKALHLVDVQSLPGSAARPACAIDAGSQAGARVVDDARCVAASGLTTESTLTTWTRPGGALPVRLVQHSVVPPATKPLATGTTVVDGAVRWGLPDEPWRLELAVPADAWVVLLDDADRAVDVCAPAADLQPLTRVPLARCVVRGRGGSVVVAAAPPAGAGDVDPFEVRADLLRFAAFDEPARILGGVFELKPRGPGREHLRFAKDGQERSLRVEGYGVKACAIHTEDGGRIAGCRAVIPAGLGGDVVIEHDGRGLRATLGAKGDVYGNRFGRLSASTGATLAPGRAEQLSGVLVDKKATVPARGVLRLRATGGVCAVATAAGTARVLQSEGLGGGCDLRVVVDKGDHRLLVRSFGGAALSGTLGWSFEPLTVLGEGKGKETLVQPGEARVFEVTLLSDGELGVGIQVDAEVLECALLNPAQEVVADGCQIFGRFEKGTYHLRVEAPPDAGPRRFAPVVFGLQGADVDVPDDYLREFFRRVPRPKDAAKDAKADTSSTAETAKEVR